MDEPLNYPLVHDEDEDGNEVLHPIVQSIKDGNKIASVAIDSFFEDDHCPCVDATITMVNGEEYQVGLWWLYTEALRPIFGASYGSPQAIDDLVKAFFTFD